MLLFLSALNGEVYVYLVSCPRKIEVRVMVMNVPVFCDVLGSV